MQNCAIYDAIIERRSTAKLDAPAPDDVVLAKMFKAAESAPDHGRLKPWRFYVIQGEALHALGETYTRATSVFDTNDERVLDKARAMPLRAPMIIVATANISQGKIPEIEQYVAVGVAVQNMQLVAAEAGFASMWRTGGIAYDPAIKQLFNLSETDQIIGFLYVGSSEADAQPRDDAKLTEQVSQHAYHWYSEDRIEPFSPLQPASETA